MELPLLRMTTKMEFQPADRFSLAELADLWRQAYEGYFVPLAFDEEQLLRRIFEPMVERRQDADESPSVSFSRVVKRW